MLLLYFTQILFGSKSPTFAASVVEFLVLFPKDMYNLTNVSYIAIILSEASSPLQPIPWRDMARCKPIWALTIASMGHGYGFTVVLSFMPTYLKTMQGYDIKQVSFTRLS
jgi:hypothetical protein